VGLFKRVNERIEAKADEARKKGYSKAIESGASEQDARAEGEKAAKRKARRQRAGINGGAHGG
jgi:hypothetical protein